MSYYDRYSRFRGENSSHIMPNVEITPSSTDITVIFKRILCVWIHYHTNITTMQITDG